MLEKMNLKVRKRIEHCLLTCLLIKGWDPNPCTDPSGNPERARMQGLMRGRNLTASLYIRTNSHRLVNPAALLCVW